MSLIFLPREGLIISKASRQRPYWRRGLIREEVEGTDKKPSEALLHTLLPLKNLQY